MEREESVSLRKQLDDMVKRLEELQSASAEKLSQMETQNLSSTQQLESEKNAHLALQETHAATLASISRLVGFFLSHVRAPEVC